MTYKTRTTLELFKAFQFENGRVCEEDANATKKAITNELYRRLKIALTLLEDAKTESDAMQIYKQFIEF